MQLTVAVKGASQYRVTLECHGHNDNRSGKRAGFIGAGKPEAYWKVTIIGVPGSVPGWSS